MRPRRVPSHERLHGVPVKSRKQRLIEALDRELDKPQPDASKRYRYTTALRALRNRGSGPLPWYLIALAEELGVE